MGLTFSDLVKTCCYSEKQQFHNYDSSIVNEPLLGLWRPSNGGCTSLQQWVQLNVGKNSPLATGVLSDFWATVDAQNTKTVCSPADQISALVHLAHLEGLRVRAVGTGASWSGVTKGQDILVETTCLDQITSSRPGFVWCERDQKSYNTVSVQSGMLVKDFCQRIDENFGLALPVLGNYAGQTVGGLVATSSHGSSKHCMTMASYVHSLHLVTEGGVKIKLRYQKPNEKPTSLDQVSKLISERLANFSPFHEPIEVANDFITESAIVSLGCFGVVYELEFYCEAAYDIAETRIAFEIPEKCIDSSEGVITLPHIIRNGLGMYPSSKKDITNCNNDKDSNFFFSFFVNPIPTDNNSIRCTILQGAKVSRLKCSGDVSAQTRVQSSNRNDSLKRSESQKIEVNLSAEKCSCALCWITCGNVCERRGLNTTIQLIQKDIAAAGLHTISLFGNESMKREATTFAMYGFEHSATRIDKWFEILQITQGHIHIRTAEWCMPLEDLEKALYEVISLSRKHSLKYGTTTSLLPIFVRCMRADSLPLSPASEMRPDGATRCTHYAFIELPFLPGSYGVDEYHQLLEAKLGSRFGARPHWAKNNFLSSPSVQTLYPMLSRWHGVADVFNRSNTFSNVYSHQCGLTSPIDLQTRITQPTSKIIEPSNPTTRGPTSTCMLESPENSISFVVSN